MHDISTTIFNIGLDEPVKLLHITDIHITKANDQDSDMYKELMERRVDTFYNEGKCPPSTPSQYFEKAIALAKEKDALLINTGDAIDLHINGCLEEYNRIADGVDMMFTPGGHEYQRHFVRTMEEGTEYVEKVSKQLEKDFPNYNLALSSRVIGGVNIVCANNALDYYSKTTLELFKKELEKGLPMLVFSHDPIWDSLLNKTAPYHPNIKLTPEDYKASHEMIDLLLNHPLVIATIAGHNHFNQTHLINGKTHYTTAGLFKGSCRYIEIR